jgi:lipopolysaccharide/colanic/teichoic acid biosynthesis glycosyltransferase
MIKRLFDIIFSFFGLLILLPIFIVIAIGIKLESIGGIFYRQTRVGRNNLDFKIIKFRTMFVNSDAKGLLTLGDHDNRVTKLGYYLRKYKLDELPQLINVLIGNMSFVGPRPEVRKYVSHYSKEDLEIFKIKPGITDYASIAFRDEAELLKATSDPEKLYIEDIMPKKIALNKKYLNNYSLIADVKIILKTILTIIK